MVENAARMIGVFMLSLKAGALFKGNGLRLCLLFPRKESLCI